MRQRNIDYLPLVGAQTREQTSNVGMYPDQVLNPWHFSSWDDAPTNWATTARAVSVILILVFLKTNDIELIFHLYIFFEVFIQIFCPFLGWVFFKCWILRILYIFWICFFYKSDMWFVNNVLTTACLFILLQGLSQIKSFLAKLKLTIFILWFILLMLSSNYLIQGL